MRQGRDEEARAGGGAGRRWMSGEEADGGAGGQATSASEGRGITDAADGGGDREEGEEEESGRGEGRKEDVGCRK
eukprot:753225-Hanusia_phi.AAC.7